MPYKGIKILEFNQYQNFDKTPLFIYVDLEYLIENVGGCENNTNIRLQ